MLFVFLSVANDAQQSEAELPLLLCFLVVVYWHNIGTVHAVSVAGECLHANRNIFLMNILKLEKNVCVSLFFFSFFCWTLKFSEFLLPPLSGDLLARLPFVGLTRGFRPPHGSSNKAGVVLVQAPSHQCPC